MTAYKLKKILIILLVVAAAQIKFVSPCQAVIPMETDILQSAGKIGEWIQKQIIWVQDKIDEISNSSFGQFIGDGINKAKKYRAVLNSCIHQGQEIYTYTEKDKITKTKKTVEDECPKWTKWVSYKRIKGLILNSKTYKIFKLTEKITDNAIEISRLNEEREATIKQIKQDAEDRKVMLDEKIKIARDNLNFYKNNTPGAANIPMEEIGEMDNVAERRAAVRRVKSNYARSMDKVEHSGNVVRAYNELLDLQSERFEVDTKKIERIAKIDVDFTNRIAQIVNERKRDIEELANLKSHSGETMPTDIDLKQSLKDVIGHVTEKFRRPKEGATESERKSFIIAEQKEVAVEGINTLNENLQAANDSVNDTEVNSDMSANADGQAEAIRVSHITNTIIKIETIKKIIDAELLQMEVEMLSIIQSGANYTPEETEESKVSTVVDICDYVLPENQPANYGDKLRAGIDYVKSNIANAEETKTSDNNENEVVINPEDIAVDEDEVVINPEDIAVDEDEIIDETNMN